MGAQLRVYRRRMRSVKATKKITRAMELISASRIVKAQQRVTSSTPYAEELTRAVGMVGTYSRIEHVLTGKDAAPTRAAILVIAADRGMAGAYSNAAIKEGDRLSTELRERGLSVQTMLVGRKAINFYRFRDREFAASWSGFSDNPTFANAVSVASALIAAASTPATEKTEVEGIGVLHGVDEVHIVFTQFKSMITQEPISVQVLPVVFEDKAAQEIKASGALLPQYEFEPGAIEVLDALLPRYIEARVFNAMLQSAASEHAARRRAMKSATDNADELIKSLTRLANAARQAEITQEISEIVGGADALASSTAGSE
jgi:F-type H+-transporting ATPase subunit gamma